MIQILQHLLLGFCLFHQKRKQNLSEGTVFAFCESFLEVVYIIDDIPPTLQWLILLTINFFHLQNC